MSSFSSLRTRQRRVKQSPERQYFVYFLTNKNNTVIYTGITNDLIRRVWEHKQRLIRGFTTKYHVDKLVYFEILRDAVSAIAREKQIKGGSRLKKIGLISQNNPAWNDIYEGLL